MPFGMSSQRKRLATVRNNSIPVNRMILTHVAEDWTTFHPHMVSSRLAQRLNNVIIVGQELSSCPYAGNSVDVLTVGSQ